MLRDEWQQVATDYEWRTVQVGADDDSQGLARFLVGESASVLCATGPVVRNYDPITKPRLFREFVELDGRPDSFLTFARKYGPLGINTFPPRDLADEKRRQDTRTRLVEIAERLKRGDIKAGDGVATADVTLEDLPMFQRDAQRELEALQRDRNRGEPYNLAGYSSWYGAFRELWLVAAYWDAARAPTIRGKLPPPGLESRPTADGYIGVAPLIPQAEIEQAERAATRGKQKDVITRALAEKIEEDVTAAVAKYIGAPRIHKRYVGRGKVRFTQDPAPRTLIGVLWLQCLWEITGEQGYSRCLNCNKWIAFSRRRRGEKGRRPDARFCSGDLCRATWHQDHKPTRNTTNRGKKRNGKATRKRRR